MPFQILPSKSKPAAKKPGALKKDINLLPANVASEKLARRGTIALAVLVGVLIVAYFAIAMPAFALNKLQSSVAAVENQAKLLAPAEAEAMTKAAERDKKAQIIAFAQEADASYTQPADIMATLERACPETVMLTSFTLNASGIMVNGYTNDDEQIAQLMVNLKSIFPQYPVVTLVSASDTDTENTRWQRQFQVTAAPQESASAAPAGTAAPQQTEGGDAQ